MSSSKAMDSPRAQDAHRLVAWATGRRIRPRGYFTAPVPVEAAELAGDTTVFVRVRTAGGGLDEVPVTIVDLEAALQDQSSTAAGIVAPDDLFLLIESNRIRLAHAYDPFFAVSLSGIEPLPHQLEAVYLQMLPQLRLRFLLAHDPGAGKTGMCGLLMKTLKLRGALYHAQSGRHRRVRTFPALSRRGSVGGFSCGPGDDRARGTPLFPPTNKGGGEGSGGAPVLHQADRRDETVRPAPPREGAVRRRDRV